MTATMRVCVVTALALTFFLFAWLLNPVRDYAGTARDARAIANPPSPVQPNAPPAATPDKQARSAFAAAAPENSMVSTSAAALLEENRKLRATNALLQERLQALLNWILANFRGRFPIPETLFSRVQIQPLTDDYQLNPEIAELLRLTDDDVGRMNDAFAYAARYMSDIEAAILAASEPYRGKIILHIPTFRENGELLKEDLYSALQATLGNERFTRFLKVAENGLKSRFSHFGEASRTMVFELTYEKNDPTPHILIKDGYVLEIEPGIRQITATEMSGTNIPPQYAAYLAWLPDYITSPEREQ